MKYKLVALIGASGSGKDTIRDKILKETDWHRVVGCTTRPSRGSEIEGATYHFLSLADFHNQLVEGDFAESTVFNEWCYGTRYKDLSEDKINIGIFNPEAIDILVEDSKIDLIIFYIHASDKTRLIRSLNRENVPDVDEIVRRYETDKVDFERFRMYYSPNRYIWCENNNDNSITRCINLILDKTEQKFTDKN